MWSAVLGFMGVGLASGLSLASHCVRVLPGKARIPQPRWIPVRRILGGQMDWHLLFPFNLSQILSVGGSLLVPRPWPGPPVLI